MKDDLLFLIENIPSVLKLYVPGIISLLVYLFFNGGKLSTTTKAYSAVILSYTLCSLVELISKISWLRWMASSVWTVSATATILGVLMACLISYIIRNDYIAELSNKHLHRTLLNTWDVMLDLDNGTTLAIYEKGKDYFVAGNFMLLDDSTKDPWVVLNGYKKFATSNREVIGAYCEGQCRYMIKMSDVEHFEFFYDKYNDNVTFST